jgi:hypothetical protein
VSIGRRLRAAPRLNHLRAGLGERKICPLDELPKPVQRTGANWRAARKSPPTVVESFNLKHPAAGRPYHEHPRFVYNSVPIAAALAYAGEDMGAGCGSGKFSASPQCWAWLGPRKVQ